MLLPRVRLLRLAGPGTWLIVATIALATLLPTTARAQGTIDAQSLLADIVDDYGPKYQDVELAIESLRGGRTAEAIQSLRMARQKNPNLPPANLMLAQLLFRSRQASQAQAALQEAVREDRNDPGAYVYLGEIALQSGRLAEAELLYDKALDLGSRYSTNRKRRDRLMVSAYSGKVSLYELREDWTEAKALLDKSLQIDPNNSLSLTRKGRVLFKMSSTREEQRDVYEIFKKLHAEDENTAHPDVNMALLYQQSGKTANAKQLMARAAQSDANNIRTRLAAAKWALNAGELDMAQENAQAAMQLDSGSLEAKLYVGLVARFRNDLLKAEQVFRDAHAQSPRHLGANTQLTLVLIEQADERKRAQALDYARLNTQLYSDLKDASGREAAVTLAWVLSRMGQKGAAERAVQQALNAGTSRLSADSGYHAAQILYDGGLTEVAQQLLEQALSSESVFPNRQAAEQLLSRIRNR